MGRPADYEWEVLGESQDPIPGDPYEVRNEATRLGKMAQSIREQVKLLTAIASDENRGKFKDQLDKKASDLKGDLGKVADRYEAVAGYLGNWATDLEYCQSESLKALVKAQQVAPQANAPEVHPAPGSPQPQLTPEQQRQQLAAQKAKEAAQSELADAKRQLDNAKQHRDDRGRYWMQKIEDTEHDDLKDSTWDGVKDFIHEHAALIKLLSDVCTWIVTALVIASMLIPGVNVAVWVLAIIMSAALLSHTALAASGDGSWTDVAMDVIGLATLGAGALAGKGLQSAGKVAEGLIQGSAEGAGGGAAALEEGEEAGARAAASAAGEAGGEAAQGGFRTAGSKLANYGNYLKQTARGGFDAEAGENCAKIQRAIELKPDSRWATNVTARSLSNVKTMGTANVIANTFDQFGHWSGNSDAINFVHHGVTTGNWTDGPILGSGALHPNIEDDFAPHPFKWMDDFKTMTTHEIGS
ncbi:MAG: hypothetical protein JO362_16360 [Streptomycetaceae bacterium]|nr:hypothetical protein [Streptomycetaceae bacterium]